MGLRPSSRPLPGANIQLNAQNTSLAHHYQRLRLANHSSVVQD